MTGLDAKSEVILRHRDKLKSDILLVNAPQDYLASELAEQQIQHWTWNFADFQFFNQNQYTAHFETHVPTGSFEQAIIFVPKSKELLNYILAQCINLLGLGKTIYLVGEKKAGIEGSAKQLVPFGKTIKIDSARHCQLWQLSIHSLAEDKPLIAWAKQYHYQHLDNLDLTIYALPGVFSQSHLDIGTKEILPFLSKVRFGEILDFGCGAGIISAVLAKLNEKNQITAVDIDKFALASTALTFERNGLATQLKLQAVEDIKDLTQHFDAIVSNPPFHQGIKTHYQASENLCIYAHQHLKPRGELWIVANRFLNYPPFIEKNFGQCQLKADQHGFKVLFAQK